MEEEALTEPLLPRDRDDSSMHSVVNIAAASTATAPAHRRAINDAVAATAKYAAFYVALENDYASGKTASPTSRPSPSTARTPLLKVPSMWTTPPPSTTPPPPLRPLSRRPYL